MIAGTSNSEGFLPIRTAAAHSSALSIKHLVIKARPLRLSLIGLIITIHHDPRSVNSLLPDIVVRVLSQTIRRVSIAFRKSKSSTIHHVQITFIILVVIIHIESEPILRWSSPVIESQSQLRLVFVPPVLRLFHKTVNASKQLRSICVNFRGVCSYIRIRGHSRLVPVPSILLSLREQC